MKVHAPRPFTQLNGQEASLSHITPETATRGRQEGGVSFTSYPLEPAALGSTCGRTGYRISRG